MFVHGSVTNIDRYLESRRYTGKPRSPQVSTPVNFDRDLLPEPISAKRIRFMVLTVIAIWTAIGLMNTLQRIANTTDMRETYSIWLLIKIGMGTHWLKAALSLPLVLFVMRWPLGVTNWKTRLPLHLLALMLYTVVFIVVRPYVVPTVYYGGPVPPVISFWESSYVALRSFLLDIIYGFLITILGAYLWQYTLKVRNAQLMQERLQTRVIGAELQALKMQLQPHFLFNTLHTISNLAATDSRKAQVMIARLGELLRISLEHVSSESVPLRRELEFLSSYLEIERTRFEERLKVEIDVDSQAMNAEVPNMILQPLVENSIRHGISRKVDGGLITIRAHRQSNRIQIEVSDDGGDLTSEVHAGMGIGLSNTQARLQQSYGMDYRFEINSTKTGTTVLIDIPFLAVTETALQELADP
jgi:two-component system LytT family sensor kinase